MSTAVLISGQMRTFAKCYPTQRWQIFRHYEPDIHFFVSCADDAQADSTSILLRDYENVHFERYQDPVDLPEIPLDKGAWAPYANAASHNKLMLQHWGNKEVWDLYERQFTTPCQTFIRIRPDLWIHRFRRPDFDTYHVPSPHLNTAFCPWWGKFGGVNDRLAVMGYEAAYAYFNVFNRIDELLKRGCPFHPETLVAASLESAGIDVQNTLMTEFSTMRMDGSQRWAEIIWSDIAELIATRDGKE